MFAVRAHPMKPATVIYQKPENIDDLALHLSRLENIPLLVSDLEIQEIIDALEKVGDV